MLVDVRVTNPDGQSVTASGGYNAVIALPPPVGEHGYFNLLAARPDRLSAFSMRDPKQLDIPNRGGYAHSNSRALVVTYDPMNDPDPRRQDAAKIVIGTGSNSLTNQVRFPIPDHSPGSLFATWDVWMGREFNYGIAGIPDYKTFQFGSPYHDIHMEIRNRFQLAGASGGDNVGIIDGRLYPEGGYSQGPDVTFADTLKPRVGNFKMKPETWTRFWAHFDDPAGSNIWYEYSLWAADRFTGPVLIYDRLDVRPSPSSTKAAWESFWLEYNTSTAAIKVGRPVLISYARNFVALRGIEQADVPALLVAPSF